MKKGNAMQAIIVFYILFISLYAFYVIAMTDFFDGSQYVGIQESQSNITSTGNRTTQGTTIGEIDNLKCEGDMFACSLETVGLMYSLDSPVTPFPYFNFFVWVFTFLFFVAIVTEIIIPIIPG